MLQLGWIRSPNAAAGMDQVPKKLHTCIACYVHALHAYMHVPHVTCVYCMLHMLIACQSVTHVVAGYNGKM